MRIRINMLNQSAKLLINAERPRRLLSILGLKNFRLKASNRLKRVTYGVSEIRGLASSFLVSKWKSEFATVCEKIKILSLRFRGRLTHLVDS